MGPADGSSGNDYEKMLFEHQSEKAQLESKVAELELQVENLKKENAKLKRLVVDKKKKSKTKELGLEEYGASFQ